MGIFQLGRTYKTVRRLQQVINVFLLHGFGAIIDQIHLGRYIPFFKRLKSFGHWPQLEAPGMAARLREAFAELGPSFIKLAQILSTRPDLITARYAEEFRKLQDRVPPFPAEEAKAIVESELDLPLEFVFKEFDPTPVAAASIAQVHRAVLLDGSEVMVKVQRPNIHSILDLDIEILSTIARLLETHVPESRNFNPTGVVQEFDRTVMKELRFLEEARNACRFRQNFADRPEIYIPMMYPDLLTERVIVMEHIKGVRIDDIAGIERLGFDRKEIAHTGVDAYFKMIFEDGFFHADPHPGNLFVMPDGKIAFVDFGIVGRVSEKLKTALANTFVALMNKDYERLVDQYIELGVITEDMDTDEFRREFKADLEDFIAPLYDMTLGEINFAAYMEAYIRFAVKHGLKVPKELMLIDKAILILQDVGLRLDPKFDFMAASEPYVKKLITEKYGPTQLIGEASKNLHEAVDFAVVFPRQMKKLLRKTLRNDLHINLTHKGIDRLIRDMDRSSNRISFALVIAAILVSSAIMHGTEVGPTIYGLSVLGLISFGFAALMGVWLVISIMRSGRM